MGTPLSWRRLAFLARCKERSPTQEEVASFRASGAAITGDSIEATVMYDALPESRQREYAVDLCARLLLGTGTVSLWE